MTRICILGPSPEYSALAEAEAAEYQRLFADNLEIRCWLDAGDLTEFDLVMPLLAWGYHLHAERWFAALDAWEAAGVRLANTIPLLRWNSDKRYLLDFAAKGGPVVPTRLSDALSPDDLDAARAAFDSDVLVVKPPLSAGSDRTYRLSPGDELPADAAHQPMLIQPLMPAIEAEGELSLFYFDGAFSHAICKRPAPGEFRVQSQFGGREEAVEPCPAAFACAASFELAPNPFYARIDMVRDGDRFLLMELELIEPSLFLDVAPDGGQAFAEAVKRRSR